MHLRAEQRNYGSLGLSAQTGVVQAAILFGIALLTAIIGGFAMANRTPTAKIDDKQAKVNASVFVRQGMSLREGVTRFVFDHVDSSVMTFDTTASSGLFDPAQQYAYVQVGPNLAYGNRVPPNIAPATPRSGSYTLQKTIVVPDVGSTAAEWLVSTVFFDLRTCNEINLMLYGSAAPATPPQSTLTAAQWQAGSGVETLANTVSGWGEGCLEASVADSNGNKYVYFKVVRDG